MRPPCTRDDALRVLRTLRGAGHVAYFAGGCVRDTLLALTPKDWDVATDAPPARVRELFRKTQSVGAAFGVILVREGKSIIEVATFRSDGKYEDGRHPSEVKYTTAEQDAQRRDFTINGLFLDPRDDEASTDRVIDFVGGRADIESKTLRAIGDPNRRFDEDQLRLLRAVRFAARFGFTIEPATSNAIRSHAPKLIRISPERIAEELRLMLTPPTRIGAVRMLRELGLLDAVLRDVRSQEAEDLSLFDLVAPSRSIAFPLALAALTATRFGNDAIRLDRPAIRTIERSHRATLRISNDESEAFAHILELVRIAADPAPRVATLKRFLADANSSDARLLLVALGENTGNASIRELLARLDALDGTDAHPSPLLTGDDLTAAGFAPGPVFKRVLDAVYDAQLEDRLHSREQALEMARSLLAAT